MNFKKIFLTRRRFACGRGKCRQSNFSWIKRVIGLKRRWSRKGLIWRLSVHRSQVLNSCANDHVKVGILFLKFFHSSHFYEILSGIIFSSDSCRFYSDNKRNFCNCRSLSIALISNYRDKVIVTHYLCENQEWFYFIIP